MKGIPEPVRVTVGIEGRARIMFDRYAGQDTKLSPGDKLYLTEAGEIVLPTVNVLSFLTAQNTDSAVKCIFPPKVYKNIAKGIAANVRIQDEAIPLLRDGKPIVFKGFKDGVDKSSGCIVHRAVARLAKGIPNDKERPLLSLPWSMCITLFVDANESFNLNDLERLFREGGKKVGFGTFRPFFGQFELVQFDIEKLPK